MSEEIKKNETEQNGGMDEMFQAAFGKEACEGVKKAGGRGVEAPLETMKEASDQMAGEAKRRLEREAKDCLMLGGLCGLGVVSLIAAAVSGVWLPVAVGLGVCLSGAAGALIYRGWAVLRG